VSLQFVWKELEVTIRFEVRTEYFTVSTFVEFDRTREIKGAYRDRGLSDAIAKITGYLGSDASGEGVATQINQYCFHDFWKMYEKELLSDKRLSEITNDDIFKNIFADFRGFVAPDHAAAFPDDGFFEGDKPARWGLDAKRKLLPLIEHRNKAEHKRYECAVNYLLDGRALYMSTLGPQFVTSLTSGQSDPSEPKDGQAQEIDARIPVEFIVYARQRYGDKTVVNKWQLGRLVNQILLLGTVRLCALKDLRALHESGQQLGQLDRCTQAARDAIAKTESVAKKAAGQNSPQNQLAASDDKKAGITGPKAGDAETRKDADDKDVMELIGEAHETLNKITGDFLKEATTGLSYRIERSRYYVKQFDENVKLLRIKRLEGDQPYDEFIRRRLGSEFDFIDRLGIRYERATANVVSLDQNYLAITQNDLVKQANQIDEDIHDIQKYGELFLLAALVPYYVTHLLVLIFGEELAPVIAGNVWIGFVVLAIANFFKIWRKKWQLSAVLETIASAPGKTRNYIREHGSLAGIAVFVLVVGVTAWFAGPPFETWLGDKQKEREQQGLAETSKKILEAQKELRATVEEGIKALQKLRADDGSKPAGGPPQAPAKSGAAPALISPAPDVVPPADRAPISSPGPKEPDKGGG
jgi:hypothetical protein